MYVSSPNGCWKQADEDRIPSTMVFIKPVLQRRRKRMIGASLLSSPPLTKSKTS